MNRFFGSHSSSSHLFARKISACDRPGRMAGVVPARMFCAVLALAILGIQPAFGQQRPEVGYVFPPGGRAGTTVAVRLGGYDFTPDTQFFVLDKRVELKVLGPPSEMLFLPPPFWFGPKARNKAFSVPREVPAMFVLPADMPSGVIQWQAANANGATTRGEFVVSRDSNEVIESEQLADGPQKLPRLPVTVSGCLKKKEEIDRYRFTVTQSGPVTCRLPAHRFGHPIHAIANVSNSSGQRIAEFADTEGKGLAFTFSAMAGETYTLSLHDLDYRGDRSMVYRLTIEQAPLVVAAIPAAGQRGTSREVTFVGYGLATGKPKLESVVRKVNFPDSPNQGSLSYRLKTKFGVAAPFMFGLSDFAEGVESTTNDDGQRLGTPSAVTGMLEDPLQADHYLLQVVKGESYSIKVDAKRIGSPLDVSVIVLDPNGRKVAENDDVAGTTDAEVTFQAKADSDYRVTVSDLSGRAGTATSVYRLSVTQPTPGFRISAAEQVETIYGAEPVDVSGKKKRKKGQPGVLTVQAIRSGGFQGKVALEIDGLSDNINIPGEIEIPEKQTQVDIPVSCSIDGDSFASLATVRASAELEDGTRISDQSVVLVAPVMKPRAVVRPYYPDAGRTVHRGATYLAPVVLERLEDYKGEIELQMAARPDRVRQGISGRDIVVPAGVDQTEYPLFLPEWVQTDRTSRIVLNTVVNVPDGQGNVRHLVNRMDRRITMNVEGALLKLSAAETEFSLKPGQSIDVHLSVLRSGKFNGPVEITLDPNNAGSKIFAVEPVSVAPGQSETVLRVTASQGDWSSGERELTLRASGSLGDAKVRIMSTARIFVMLRNDRHGEK